MTGRFHDAWKSFGPALAAGLFCGRFLSELWAYQQESATGLSFTSVLTITSTATFIFLWLIRMFELRRTWPLLILIVYPLFPEPDPRIAVTVLAVVLVTTGQQLIDTRIDRLAGAKAIFFIVLLALLFFALYASTLAPDVLTADNGEFQLVAANLGVAHPPGFSLYTLLAHLMTRLPGQASAAVKVNLLSAITSTLTLAVVALIVCHIAARPLATLTAIIALGTSTTYWSQATTSNIRSLTVLFISLAIYFALLYWSASQPKAAGALRFQVPRQAISRNHADLYLTLFFLSLASGIVHHASLLFIGLILLLFIFKADPSIARNPRRWKKPFVASLVSLLPLLYLPWQGYLAASGRAIRGASPALTSWSGFLDHVLALGFRGDLFYFLEPSMLWERMKVIGNVMTFQFSPWVLAGMGLGFVLMLRRDRQLALLLCGSFALHALVTATYRAPQTVEYLLPAYIPAIICLGYAAGKLEEAIPWKEKGRMVVGHIFAAIMLVAAVVQGIDRYSSFRHLHLDTTARDYVQTLLDRVPPDTLILADWHWATPLWYLQEVEQQRNDVDIRFVFPTGESYADTWVRRIGEAVDADRPVVSTHYEERAFSQLPVPEPIGEAFLFRVTPRLDLPETFAPLRLMLGNKIEILGYELSHTAVPIGQEVMLTIAWQPLSTLDEPISLFAHVVGNDGQIYAQQDPLARPRAAGATLTQFRLTPRLGTAPGKHEIMIGAYGQAPLLDERGEARTTIASLSLQHMPRPPVTNNPIYRQLSAASANRRLIGYDWDNTLSDEIRLYLHWQTEFGFQTEVKDQMPPEAATLPAYIGPWGISHRTGSLPFDATSHYVPFAEGIVWMGPLLADSARLQPGTQVWLRQIFRSNQPITRDIATSVRLIGYELDNRLWDWWDLDDAYGIPALGAIPTLKWIRGSTIFDAHLLQVDDEAYLGQTVGAALGLYDAFTGRRLAVLDQRFSREMAWRLTQIMPAD